MEIYLSNGVTALNAYLWERLQVLNHLGSPVFELFLSGQYGNVVPIFPSKQPPEITGIEGGPTFLVFDYRVVSSNAMWWVSEEQVVYTIFGGDEAQLRVVSNYMIDLLGREDWSAADANTVATGVDFKCIYVSSTSGLLAPVQEGGQWSTTVSVKYDFTYERDTHGLSGMRV